MTRPILHLCHGCDAEKAATDFCPNCEEVTPVYEYDGTPEAFARKDRLIARLSTNPFTGADMAPRLERAA